jgi:8-oxo-dGTP diphosphatase
MIRYCPACAAALPGPPPVTCAGCGYAQYVNPRPTGGTIIRDGDRVLIVRRAREPKAGEWELPGGFCDGWELPADAAVRETREELGIEVLLDRFVGMYLARYEFQGEILPVLDCFCQARIVSGDLRLNPAELLEHRWVSLADRPPMAFASMDLALADVAR